MRQLAVRQFAMRLSLQNLPEEAGHENQFMPGQSMPGIRPSHKR
jgi:hypothetical protein